METSTCYICLENSMGSTPTGCMCKGSMTIHSSCFRQWMETTNNPLCCCVCKSNFSVSFLRQFMTDEQLLFAGESSDEEEDGYDEDRIIYGICLSNHGLPDAMIDEDGNICFESERHETIFIHSTKMEKRAIRQQTRQKVPFNRHTNKGRRVSFSYRR